MYVLLDGIGVCLLIVVCILEISSVATASSSTLVIVGARSLASTIVFVVDPLLSVTMLLVCWRDLDGVRWGMPDWHHAICHLWGIVSSLWLCCGGSHL